MCPICQQVVTVKSVRKQAKREEWGEKLLAVLHSDSFGEGKFYRSTAELDLIVFRKAEQKLKQLQEESTTSIIPNEPMSGWEREVRPPLYGISTWGEIFNFRQFLALATFTKLTNEVLVEALKSGMQDELTKAVTTIVALAVDRLADYNSPGVLGGRRP